MNERSTKTERLKDSSLGKIPKDWDIQTLGDLGNFQNGLNKSKDDFGFGTKFVNIADVYLPRLDINNLGRMNASDSELSSYRLEVGDILIDRSSVKLEGVGYPTVFEGAEEQIIFCGFIIRFRLTNFDIRPRYLCEFMRDDLFRNRIFQIATKSANVNVNQEQLSRLKVGLPFAYEQDKIIEILDTIDRAIARTESLIQKLKQIKAGLLHDLLTCGLDKNGELRNPTKHPEQFKNSPLGQIPKEWSIESLGEQIEHLDSGWSPVCNPQPKVEGEWGVLKTTAVVWSGYNSSENKQLPFYLEPKYRAVVKKDDILITRKGPRERVGVVVHISSTPEQLIMPDTVFRVRLKQCSKLLPSYSPLILGSISIQRDWNRKKIGLAEAQVDINYGIVRETIISIPFESEQKQIIKIDRLYNNRIKKEEAHRDKLKLKKKGLMQDLLTGKVRVKDIISAET